MFSDKKIKVWLCNLNVNDQWSKGMSTAKRMKSESDAYLLNRLAEVNILLCNSGDYVFLTNTPEKEFLEDVKALGMPIPNILVLKDCGDKDISGQILEEYERFKEQIAEKEYLFVCYGASEKEVEIADKYSLEMFWPRDWRVQKNINSKVFSRELARKLGLTVPPGGIIGNTEEMNQKYETLLSDGFEQVILKDAFGTSGKGLYVAKNEKELKAFSMLLGVVKNEGFRFILEGWVDKEIDINYQIYISETGMVELISISEQVMKKTIYRGSRIPPRISDQSKKIYEIVAVMIGRELYKLGYWGVAGIDSFIDKEGTIYPMIEINARMNFSTYLYNIMKRFEGRKIIKTVYNDINTSIPISYNTFKRALVQKGLYYKGASEEGIFIYNSSTFSYFYDESKKRYMSRVYLLLISDSEENIDLYSTSINKILEKMSLE